MRYHSITARASALVALLLAVSACAPTIAPYSVEAYKAATSLKAETDALLAQGTEPFAGHAADVQALQVRLNAAYEFAKGLPKNANSAALWAKMVDPNGGMAGGAFSLWKTQSTLSPAFVTEKRQQVADGFSLIICLEANKQKPSVCNAPGTGDGQ